MIKQIGRVRSSPTMNAQCFLSGDPFGSAVYHKQLLFHTGRTECVYRQGALSAAYLEPAKLVQLLPFSRSQSTATPLYSSTQTIPICNSAWFHFATMLKRHLMLPCAHFSNYKMSMCLPLSVLLCLALKLVSPLEKCFGGQNSIAALLDQFSIRALSL